MNWWAVCYHSGFSSWEAGDLCFNLDTHLFPSQHPHSGPPHPSSGKLFLGREFPWWPTSTSDVSSQHHTHAHTHTKVWQTTQWKQWQTVLIDHLSTPRTITTPLELRDSVENNLTATQTTQTHANTSGFLPFTLLTLPLLLKDTYTNTCTRTPIWEWAEWLWNGWRGIYRDLGAKLWNEPLNLGLKIRQKQLTSLSSSDAWRQIAFLLSCVHAEFPPLLGSGIMSSTEAWGLKKRVPFFSFTILLPSSDLRWLLQDKSLYGKLMYLFHFCKL